VSRSTDEDGPYLDRDLVIVVEGADLILPEGEIPRLGEADRHRIGVCHDWFSDPEFTEAGDCVLLVTESRSLLHHRIARLPQVLDVEVPSPDEPERLRYIEWFATHDGGKDAEPPWHSAEDLARLTGGLSIHALRQLLVGALHAGGALSADDVIAKVEEFIQRQLGDDVVEFSKPKHDLDDVIGFERLKAFLREKLIPRLRTSGPAALPGAAVCGPIGGGKTFIFEAVASELDMVVLVLKNLRSQWFGQTDVILERLSRVLQALSKVLIFVDEADTQFGGVSQGTHATERRLTGKIQAMMSDPRARGRVAWLLMTARIQALSPDIRRPGRVGDLIIPVLDPEGDDRRAFLRWVLGAVLEEEPTDEMLDEFDVMTPGYSAAAFASLRSELIAEAGEGKLQPERVREVVGDHLPPAIGRARRYQTLQALVNCTRRSLLPDADVDENDRERWRAEIRELESEGIR
jgi:hypothetical protein